MRVVAGDIGGTHARLALCEVEGAGRPVIVRERTYESREFEDLDSILRLFLDELGPLAPASARLGVACPVVAGVCRLPNLHWEVDGRRLAAATGLEEVVLVNDFDALGHALTHLAEDDVVPLQAGREIERGPRALIGAGTGLGQGFLFWEAEGYRVHASEGGHADFAPRTGREETLLRWLRERHARVSWERVVSGPGLVNAYRFLADTGFAEELPETRAEMAVRDPARVISRRALAGSDPLCVEALDIFTSAYGAQAGNLALTVLATGGVYVAGGIAPKILDKMGDGTFVQAFRDKGRLRPLLEQMPVRLVVSPQVGILGAALTGRLRPSGAGSGRP